MFTVRKPKLRTVLLIALIPVAAFVIGIMVGAVTLLSPEPTSPTTSRMTHEQLLEAAAKPGAPERFDYRFSQEELDTIAPHIKPWDCVSGKDLSEADQYHCGVDQLFTLDSLHFIPDGYTYEGALMGKQSHKLAGIRIVRKASVQGT
jgi:hypothetical protein